VHDAGPSAPPLLKYVFTSSNTERALSRRFRRQRHGSTTGRLVQDEQVIVFVDDRQVARVAERDAAPRAARPIHPDAHDVGRGQPGAGVGRSHLALVEKDLAAREARRPRGRASPGGSARRGTCPA
jgi:hypothetical protein